MFMFQWGDILALAGYPNYNLNEPYSPNTEELKKKEPIHQCGVV